MLTIGQIFKSKTVWTALFVAALNGFQAISGSLDPHLVEVVSGVTAVLAMIFRINPAQHIEGIR